MNDKTTVTIQSINKSKDRLKLKNGETFSVAKHVNLASLEPGEKVAITYTKKNGTRDATQVVQKLP